MKSVQGLFVTLLLSSCALPSTDPRIDQAPMAADTKDEVRKFFWKPNPKAFAFSPEKGTYWAAWGSSSVEAAKRIAMEGCDGGTGTTCMLFAVNHQIVWEPTDEPPMTGAPEDEPPATSIAPRPVAAAPRAAELVRAIPHDGDLGVGVGGAVFNGDESRILSWGADNTVRLWDAATGREVVPAMRHDGGIGANWGVGGAVFSGDESRILSWGADNTVRLWDAATGREVVPAMRHDGGIGGQIAAAAPDDRLQNVTAAAPPSSPEPLLDPDGKIRSQAVLRLTQAGATEDALDQISQVLREDTDPLVRSRAAIALGSLGDRRGLAALEAALADRSFSVRVQAIQALGQIGGEQAAQVLGDVLLYERDAKMRALAALALHREGSPRAQRLLDAAADDPDQQVRSAVQ
jgi:HEAT repeats